MSYTIALDIFTIRFRSVSFVHIRIVLNIFTSNNSKITVKPSPRKYWPLMDTWIECRSLKSCLMGIAFEANWIQGAFFMANERKGATIVSNYPLNYHVSFIDVWRKRCRVIMVPNFTSISMRCHFKFIKVAKPPTILIVTIILKPDWHLPNWNI